MATSLSLAAISCWIPFRKRKVASSKPALTLIYIFSHLSGLDFALGASYEFEPTFFGQAAGALVVLVMGVISSIQDAPAS